MAENKVEQVLYGLITGEVVIADGWVLASTLGWDPGAQMLHVKRKEMDNR